MSVTKSGVGPAEFAKDLILGGSSGCLAKTICAPLERVKIVLQTAKSNDGMLRTAQAIVRDQGTTALWRGNQGSPRLVKLCSATHIEHIVRANEAAGGVDVFVHSWNPEIASVLDRAYAPHLRASR